uniref:Uncharacterized protein n=1 Tax=Arcella intermedia TaxID=1963864 RepID=A0A6B2LYC2_9EUKA
MRGYARLFIVMEKFTLSLEEYIQTDSSVEVI